MIRAFLFVLLFSITVVSYCQSEKEIKFDTKVINKDVKSLASDKMEGRETGTKGAQLAADYIAKRMKEIGLAPYGIGGYFQDFNFTPKPNAHAHAHAENPKKESKPITGKNVIGYINVGAENTVVIGAHYDHLGYGTEGSLHTGKPEIHNGADDNASGVAALLFLAKHFAGLACWDDPKKSQVLKADAPRLQNNYLFIAFSGEEMGLIGSKFFVENPTIPLDKINYMLNFDMVGRLDSNKLAVNGVGTSPAWKEAIKEANLKGLNIVEGQSGIGPSDHTSFYLKGIPVLQFFTGQHADYHKPSDDIDKVNFRGIVDIGWFTFWIIEKLGDDGKLEYTKTKSERSHKAPNYKVTLGVMPDYMFSGKGMRIDGVMPDRPAEKAGMLSGDVVVKMGEIDIENMHSYMKALGQFELGDKTNVDIQRGNDRITLEVQF